MPRQRERNALQHAGRVGREQCQRYAIRLAFDGTTYQGFQSQPYKNTVQDQIEHRLRGLLKRDAKITAWGRTDSGVHAQGAVVTVDLSLEEVTKFARRNPASSSDDEGGSDRTLGAARFLHSVLKEFACNTGDAPQPHTRYGSITARSVAPVPSDFDARYSARWKRYAYYVCACEGDRTPFAWDRYAWRVRRPSLDVAAMADAATLLSSRERDFGWMCVMQPGERRDPRRKVTMRVKRVPVDNDAENTPYFLRQNGEAAMYKITCTCDFFLYKMMRRIVGILVAVGTKEAGVDALERCLDAHENGSGPHEIPAYLLQTAPAKGLCLEHIEYDIAI
ncbi:hypothetical protein ACHAWF_005185 [Thalassiosira exigua]